VQNRIEQNRTEQNSQYFTSNDFASFIQSVSQQCQQCQQCQRSMSMSMSMRMALVFGLFGPFFWLASLSSRPGQAMSAIMSGRPGRAKTSAGHRPSISVWYVHTILRYYYWYVWLKNRYIHKYVGSNHQRPTHMTNSTAAARFGFFG
jgi:hypothetical protein